MTAALLILAFIAPALYHLGVRAKLTQPIHSRYPDWLYGFMRCSACAGAWYAMGAAACFLAGGWSIFGSTSWLMVPVIGLAAIAWVPVVVDLQESALRHLSEPEAPPPVDLSALRANVLDLAETARTAAVRTPTEDAARTFNRIAEIADDIAAGL